jgi:hypothetical protein
LRGLFRDSESNNVKQIRAKIRGNTKLISLKQFNWYAPVNLYQNVVDESGTSGQPTESFWQQIRVS